MIAPDLRGAGGSERTAGGHDKKTMALAGGRSVCREPPQVGLIAAHSGRSRAFVVECVGFGRFRDGAFNCLMAPLPTICAVFADAKNLTHAHGSLSSRTKAGPLLYAHSSVAEEIPCAPGAARVWWPVSRK